MTLWVSRIVLVRLLRLRRCIVLVILAGMLGCTHETDEPCTSDKMCPPEDYPCPCLETECPSMEFGTFSLSIEEWPNGSDIPVWPPPQGGIVTGFNLVTKGTAKRADRLETTIEDADDGTLLLDDSINRVKFLCQGEGARLLPQFMVAFEWNMELEDLDDRNAVITITAVFNEGEPNEYRVSAQHHGALRVGEP